MPSTWPQRSSSGPREVSQYRIPKVGQKNHDWESINLMYHLRIRLEFRCWAVLRLELKPTENCEVLLFIDSWNLVAPAPPLKRTHSGPLEIAWDILCDLLHLSWIRLQLTRIFGPYIYVYIYISIYIHIDISNLRVITIEWLTRLFYLTASSASSASLVLEW